MQCFTVTEGCTEGIALRQLDDGYYVVVGDEGTCMKLPLRSSFRQQLQSYMEQERLSVAPKLHNIRIDYSGDDYVVTTGRKSPDPYALVLVATMAGEGGRLEYTDTKVALMGSEKRYPPLQGDRSTGVELMAFGHHKTGEATTLLKLWPGAGFRLWRNGKHLEDAPRSLICYWEGPGGTLNVRTPEKPQRFRR